MELDVGLRGVDGVRHILVGERVLPLAAWLWPKHLGGWWVLLWEEGTAGDR